MSLRIIAIDDNVQVTACAGMLAQRHVGDRRPKLAVDTISRHVTQISSAYWGSFSCGNAWMIAYRFCVTSRDDSNTRQITLREGWSITQRLIPRTDGYIIRS